MFAKSISMMFTVFNIHHKIGTPAYYCPGSRYNTNMCRDLYRIDRANPA